VEDGENLNMKQSFEYRGRTIIVKMGDIIHEETDAIVCPANSYGHMRGGVSAAIRLAGGDIIEKEAMEKSPIQIGDAIVTTAGKLKARYIIHSPTVTIPVERTTKEAVRKAVRAALRIARTYRLQSISMPGMGTGTGWLPYEDAAVIMLEEIKAELDSNECSLNMIVLVAHSENFFRILVTVAESTLKE
jgi:O-acetyl-ADP-ribose deacetylase (regulator of RNase III)